VALHEHPQTDAKSMTAPLAPDEFVTATAPLTPRRVLVLRTQRQRRQRVLLFACAMAAIWVLAAVALVVAFSGSRDAPARPAPAAGAVGRMVLPASVQQSAVIYDTAVMPLAPEEASAINAERPVDITRPIPARALRIAAESAAGLGYAAALRCLAQAVYYEAASERDEGQRAVAQVVLNRVRHPAFPSTVCGVVYQGAERVTGCQFSFTCDGSLARIPSVGGWARAERVARDALGGTVAAAVGNSTHYHANYVVPYWAPTLDKAATIGAHIFYIMRGFLGTPRAFSARYDVALETLPGALIAPAEALAGDQPGLLAPADPAAALTPKFGAPVEDTRSGDLVAGTGEAFEWREASPLLADENRGELKPAPTGALKADGGKPGSNASPAVAGPGSD
jgi:hypothetical protein